MIFARTTARTPVVVAARRTPIGTAGRALADLTVVELGARVLAAVATDVRRAGASADIGDVVLGNCMGPGGNVARVSALEAGLGDAVPGVTIDRQCASGLAAFVQAAQGIRGGDADLVLAGGAESASTAPVRAQPGSSPGVPATPYQRAPFTPAEFGDPDMGMAAEHLASVAGVSRERQDAYAAASHAKALVAREAGYFDAELVAVGQLNCDEHPRRLRESVLARMPAAFVPGGTVTAGNSCPVSDGAAVVGVVPEAARDGAPGLRLVASAVTGCDPRLPGWGPVPAVQQVCDVAGVKIDDVAAIEIVEAFAGQVLAVTDALGLDPLADDAGRVCPDGGALALGHAWGATSAVSVVRLFTRLVRGGAAAGTLGLATAAAGGGLGVAALFEVLR
ncbi:thiolase family protein [Actinobacteria bacterium YIM 96077]|uniref:Probable acetyl-CoA acetyltransferase n=1 Tax=Phytoactinopolyspora halophila TaxID=1981511 RepID=A0A329R255_9ACTN|nr:thiolase family protein [Phytoactinopolyspora halophila]AYY12107.1 thiolase family protein [Actinobacteria bacterium YIM 96077]RAW18657.1 acetyl-CoA C-acyltransferase [Phytoactinopolyspora halophila]